MPWAFALALGIVAVAAVAQDSEAPAKTDTRVAVATKGAADNPHQGADWSLFERYCTDCHNAVDWAGGVAFDTLTPDTIGEEAETFEGAVRKLRGRLMPPPGNPQPDKAAVDSLVSWLETRLDEASSTRPNPGTVVLHRLNRTEYARAIEDLLALKIDAAALLPRDTESEGFNNVASVLKVSPSFLDQYISAARDVSLQAVGDPTPSVSIKSYRASFGGQHAHIDGLPLGTRGGLGVEHFFPADGEYELNVSLFAGGGYVTGLDHPHRVVMTLDEEKVFDQELGGEEDLKAVDQGLAAAEKEIRERFQNVRLPVKAGSHRVAVTFVARTFAESDEVLQPMTPAAGKDRMPMVTGLEIRGPFDPTGISETPSRRRIFICRPESAGEELPCATEILANLARRAFRRPVTDADLEAPLRFYESGREAGTFETGIQQGLMAILSSPKFLYRIERVPQDAKPGSIYAISDVELASRLSFFLWSQGPDEKLLKLAADGRLRDPGMLEQEVRRMLADPRSRSLVTNFAYQWLEVDEIADMDPDPNLFPEFDESLRKAFQREMELFVDSVLREDQNVLKLLTADYTFVNERLALHYGIPNIRGDRFRRVELEEPSRWGLLGKGSVLMGTSYANRTAPVLRGAWILENITATPPAAPPPGVETLKENQAGQEALTVRERMEQHRSEPSCNSCHGIMDPLGFALENFDAVGKWRDRDRDALTVIDAGGELPDGTPLNGPDQLRAALTADPDLFAQALTQKLMIFALGRGLEYYDMPVVREIVRDAAQHDYRFSAIVSGIVRSDPFQMKMMPAAEGAATVAQAAVDD